MPFIVRAILAHDCSAAVIMMMIAGSTDAFDGFLARRFNWQTRLGAYLDPVADKILLAAIYISLTIAGMAPVWLAILVVARDIAILAMVAAAFAFTRFRDFPPTLWGKINTALEILTSLTLVTVCSPVQPVFSTVLIWVTAASTAWSGIHYIGRGLQMFIMRRTFLPADRRSPRG